MRGVEQHVAGEKHINARGIQFGYKKGSEAEGNSVKEYFKMLTPCQVFPQDPP